MEGRSVHVVFKPKAMLPMKFTILKTHNMLPLVLTETKTETENGIADDNVSDNNTNNNDSMVLNIGEVVSGMVAIGGGLIDNVIYH